MPTTSLREAALRQGYLSTRRSANDCARHKSVTTPTATPSTSAPCPMPNAQCSINNARENFRLRIPAPI
ncbi:MAG: hypothetical protein V7K15_05335 [Nostoc sp.]